MGHGPFGLRAIGHPPTNQATITTAAWLKGGYGRVRGGHTFFRFNPKPCPNRVPGFLWLPGTPGSKNEWSTSPPPRYRDIYSNLHPRDLVFGSTLFGSSVLKANKAPGLTFAVPGWLAAPRVTAFEVGLGSGGCAVAMAALIFAPACEAGDTFDSHASCHSLWSIL